MASQTSSFKTYSDNADGTVTDPTTGLTWMRCAMGQSWDGSTCTGTASAYNWPQANALTGTVTFAGKSDWRVPNLRELQTIVDRSAIGPAIDAVVFPNTPPSDFWAASALAVHSDYAWTVFFYDGLASFNLKYVAYQVRLVRSRQSSNTFSLTVAKTGNGTVSGSALTGISCGSACSGTYTGGTRVILNAAAAPGNIFTGWSGAGCSGTGSCAVTMGYPQKNVTASFAAFTIIDHYYTNILNRAADQGGKTFWQNEIVRMRNVGVSATEACIAMASKFYTSPEFLARSLTNEQYIQNLYQTFFYRAAEPTGLDYWKSLIAAGLPRDMVIVFTASSPRSSQQL